MSNDIQNKTACLREFEEKEYQEITRQFMAKTAAYVRENAMAVIERIKTQLDSFMANIAKQQKIQMIPVGQITLSLIRVSAWEEKKLIRMDAYDEEQLMGRNVAYQYIEADWIFTEWQAYYDSLKNAVKKKGKSLYIKEASIRKLMDRSIKKLVYILAATLKYTLNDADYLEHFQECARAEGFIISVGEYMDWQKVLYAEPPEVDIFFNLDRHPLVFQKLENKRYRDKEFCELDLRHARFTHCDFIRCSFEDTDLSDVCFVDCRFKNVDMKSGKLYGASFIACILENTDMEGIQTKWVPFAEEEQETDVYREVVYRECLIDGELTGE
ncbi:MAG: pentapeptide repeat-containing protein [Lachnospiraceae bacterium]|nr:pentapeptide repeat-containing protein [Lachnospiraceae bacterium]